jgi:hypothetical protein
MLFIIGIIAITLAPFMIFASPAGALQLALAGVAILVIDFAVWHFTERNRPR